MKQRDNFVFASPEKNLFARVYPADVLYRLYDVLKESVLVADTGLESFPSRGERIV